MQSESGDYMQALSSFSLIISCEFSVSYHEAIQMIIKVTSIN